MKRLWLVGVLLMACSAQEDVLPKKTMEWSYYTTSNGLGSNVCYTLFEDSQGNLWVGTDNGVSKFNGSTFQKYTTTDGLVNRFVNAIEETSQGSMLFGTDNGLSILDNGSWYYVPAFSGVPIYALKRDVTNLIWIGTYGFGVVRYNYEGGSYQQDVDNSCGPCNQVNAFFEDDLERMWIGTDGGVKMVANGTTKHFTKTQGLAGNEISAITQDSWGNIWLGASDTTGVTRYTAGQFTVVSLNTNDIVPVRMGGIQEDKYGQLWIGYARPWIDQKYYSGLTRYDGILMQKLPEGPPVSGIWSMLRASNGDFYLATSSSGLARFKPVKY
ncbi:MAG: hypothetical protein JNN04_11640 [Cyclobacteriaceae bacterium]|nr:hypothetical protein [Cyclobacteriaceae bacterium]